MIKINLNDKELNKAITIAAEQTRDDWNDNANHKQLKQSFIKFYRGVLKNDIDNLNTQDAFKDISDVMEFIELAPQTIDISTLDLYDYFYNKER